MLNAITHFVDSALLGRIETLLARPEAQAVLAAEQAKAHEKRLADIAERDRLQRDLEALHTRWAPRLAAARQKTEQAKRVYEETLTDQINLTAQFHSEAFDADRIYSSAREMVYQTAPAEPFAAFRERAAVALRDTQAQADLVDELRIDGFFRRSWDNNDSVIRRMAAITQSLKDADELRHEALTEAELYARFDALASAWPLVEGRPARFGRG